MWGVINFLANDFSRFAGWWALENHLWWYLVAPWAAFAFVCALASLVVGGEKIEGFTWLGIASAAGGAFGLWVIPMVVH